MNTFFPFFLPFFLSSSFSYFIILASKNKIFSPNDQEDFMKKKGVVVSFFLLLTLFWSLFYSAQAKTKYVNLAEVKKIMDEFRDALGVKCTFCHTSERNQNYEDLVGQKVSEEQLVTLVHKRTARAMLGSMLYRNQKSGQNYTCETCHQGKVEVEVK
jgi:hypothetical protein